LLIHFELHAFKKQKEQIANEDAKNHP
jgi:hypothetical protein